MKIGEVLSDASQPFYYLQGSSDAALHLLALSKLRLIEFPKQWQLVAKIGRILYLFQLVPHLSCCPIVADVHDLAIFDAVNLRRSMLWMVAQVLLPTRMTVCLPGPASSSIWTSMPGNCSWASQQRTCSGLPFPWCSPGVFFWAVALTPWLHPKSATSQLTLFCHVSPHLRLFVPGSITYWNWFCSISSTREHTKKRQCSHHSKRFCLSYWMACNGPLSWKIVSYIIGNRNWYDCRWNSNSKISLFRGCRHCHWLQAHYSSLLCCGPQDFFLLLADPAINVHGLGVRKNLGDFIAWAIITREFVLCTTTSAAQPFQPWILKRVLRALCFYVSWWSGIGFEKWRCPLTRLVTTKTS